MSFSIKLKELRKLKGVSQKDVALFLNIGERAYQNYEYGNREPSIKTLVSLAKYFKVTLDYLLGDSDEKTEGNDSSAFSKKEHDFFNRYKNLPDDYKKIMLDKLVELEEHEIVRQLLKEREKAGIMIAKGGKAMIPPELTEKEEKLLFKQFKEFLNRNK